MDPKLKHLEDRMSRLDSYADGLYKRLVELQVRLDQLSDTLVQHQKETRQSTEQLEKIYLKVEGRLEQLPFF